MGCQSVTLYELEQHLQAMADTVDLVEPEREREFATQFEAALRTAVDKRDRVGQFLAHVDSQIHLADQELKRLKERKAGLERVRERVEGYDSARSSRWAGTARGGTEGWREICSGSVCRPARPQS